MLLYRGRLDTGRALQRSRQGAVALSGMGCGREKGRQCRRTHRRRRSLLAQRTGLPVHPCRISAQTGKIRGGGQAACRRCRKTRMHWSIPANGGSSNGSSAAGCSTRASSRRPTRSRRTMLRPSRPISSMRNSMPAGTPCAGLKDPATAAQHFQRILKASNRPISVSRAWYWMGRAAEAGGSRQGRRLFRQGGDAIRARSMVSLRLRGLAERRSMSPILRRRADDRARFESREAVRAIARLEAAGHGWRADSLYRALAEELTSPGELAILSARAEKTRGPSAVAADRQDCLWPRHRRRSARLPDRRHSGKRQYQRRRQGAGLCDRPPGKRLQSGRHLAGQRARAAADSSRHGQRRRRAPWPCLFQGTADDRYRL